MQARVKLPSYLKYIPTHISSYMLECVLNCVPRVAEKFIVRNHGSVLFALNFYNTLKIHFLRDGHQSRCNNLKNSSVFFLFFETEKLFFLSTVWQWLQQYITKASMVWF